MGAGVLKHKSRFANVVCLRSWWLVKAVEGFDGKELAVMGFSNKEKEARRIFTSAPIVKRYDDFNLVTADGVYVRLLGFIDDARTEANGFSSRVCDHFLFGFPPYWEECVNKCLSKKATAVLPGMLYTGMEDSSLQAGERESADKDIFHRSLGSSNANKDQYSSVETVLRNESSGSIVQKHDTKQGEATFNSNQQKTEKNSPKTPINSESFKNYSPSEFKSKMIAAANLLLSGKEAEKKSKHLKESTPIHGTVAVGSPEAAKTLGIEAASPQAGGHETVEEGIAPGCIDSYNADKDPYLSVEPVRRNHRSASNVEKQDAKPEECTDKSNPKKRMKISAQASCKSRSVKNNLTSTAKRKRGVTADDNSPRREPAKKSEHVNESIPVHDTVAMDSPEAAKTLGIEAASPQAGEHETVEEGIAPGCMDSYDADKDPYISVETVRRNHRSASNVEKPDAKPEECTDKPNQQKRMKKRKSRSVKYTLTSTAKSKRGVTAAENSPRREPAKKSAHVNESTPVHDRAHIVSPESASFKRSRSGRLLLPCLEHWRNQRVLYDPDRKVIGVLGFDHEHPDKDC